MNVLIDTMVKAEHYRQALEKVIEAWDNRKQSGDDPVEASIALGRLVLTQLKDKP